MAADARVTPDVRRLLVAHALGAVALGLAWPALLVAVWNDTHSDAWLGAAGAARMAPYVLLSWWAGRISDRHPRRLMVVGSLALRFALLGAVAVALAGDAVFVAVVFAALAVAAGTPAYPALAAEMPALSGRSNETATGILVTCEVAAFFVGPALGGAMLGVGLSFAACALAVALTSLALVLVLRVRWAAVGGDRLAEEPAGDREPVISLLRRDRVALAAMVALVANNAVGGAVAIGLLPLARDAWSSGSAGYGTATAAVGLGALGVPLLLHRAGLSPATARWAALLMAAALGVVTISDSVVWAVVPLGLAGAASVYVEAVATGVLQQRSPDSARSSSLGLADSLMVAAAGVAAAMAPWLAEQVGPRVLLAGCVVVAAVLLALFPPTYARSDRTAPTVGREALDRQIPRQRTAASMPVGAAD